MKCNWCIKSNLSLNPLLNLICYVLFPCCLICPFLLPSFPLDSFLPFQPFPFVFQVSFLFYVPLFFPFLVIKVFYFSDNLHDNLSDNLLLEKGPRTRDRLIWSQWEEGLDKKVNRFSAVGRQVVLRLGEPNALLHNYKKLLIGTMRSQLQVLKLLSREVWRFLTPWLNQTGTRAKWPFFVFIELGFL